MIEVEGAGPDETIETIEPTLTEVDLSDVLHVPVRVLAKMRRRGQGPRWIECNGFVRYPIHEVRKFLNVPPLRKKLPKRR